MRKHKDPTKKMNIWLLSTIILFVGIVVGLSVFLYTKLVILADSTSKIEASNTTTGTSASETTLKSGVVSIDFYNKDNELIETKKVKYGDAVFPPVLENSVSGRVFIGWSQNLRCMVKNTQIYPVYNEYQEKPNVLSFDTIYVDSSNDFTVDLKLGGLVNIASFDMTVSYDSNTIHLKKASVIVPDLSVDENQGQINIKLNGKSNLSEATSLVRFTFEVEDVDLMKTELLIDLKNGNSINGGALEYVDCTMVKGIIYIY